MSTRRQHLGHEVSPASLRWLSEASLHRQPGTWHALESSSGLDTDTPEDGKTPKQQSPPHRPAQPRQSGQQVQGQSDGGAWGGHESMGSSCSKEERPSKVVLLGTNTYSPAFESLLLEDPLAARAYEMGLITSRIHQGWPSLGPWEKATGVFLVSSAPITSVPCWLCWLIHWSTLPLCQT